MTTLTDRYVYAALRTLPEQQRPDIDRELRGSIADAVDARLEAGEPADAAERAVLIELGDPARLAAGYADRPLHLIGPELYLDWWRLLKILLAVVLPFVVLAAALANYLAGEDIGGIIGGSIATTLSAAVHIVFWTTLVFFILERTPESRRSLIGWNLDRLPQVTQPGKASLLSEAAVSAAFLVIFIGALVWQQFMSVFTDAAGDPIPLLNPALWSFWLPYFIVLMLLEIVFAFAIYRRNGWDYTMAGLNVVLNVAFAVPALWLTLTGQLFNTAFFAELGEADLLQPGSPLLAIMVIAVLVIPIWDVIDGFLKARRAGKARGMAAATA